MAVISKAGIERGGNEAEIAELLQQRELLDATELIAQMGHCQWDYANNRLISCSLGYARIFHSSIDEIIELQSNWKQSLAQIHPEDQDLYLRAYRDQAHKGSYTVKYRLLRNDGETRWLRESGILKFDDAGKVEDAFGIIQDITDQVSHQHEMEQGQELARQVEAITDIGHFINDEINDIFTYISPGYARIHGHSVESFMHFVESGEDNLGAVHEADRERLRTDILEYVKNGDETFSTEYRIVRPDGEIIWIKERSKSTRLDNGQVAETLGVLQDITEKKNFEESLQKARDSLEDLVAERTAQLARTVQQLRQEVEERLQVSKELENKNAELERFTYTVSHDLKAPLVTITGFLGLLGKDLQDQDMEQAQRDIEKIHLAADTMGRLLEELLELSRIGRVVGKPVDCDLSEIAGEAANLVATVALENGVEITIEEMPGIRGDKTRLVEVFQNLFENAIKFTSDEENPQIHAGSVAKGEQHYYYVKDNGIGIPPEYQRLVFDLFERLNMNVEGTGVGLTLVKRIIEVHGGEVWIESEGSGKGCTICFTLSDLN